MLVYVTLIALLCAFLYGAVYALLDMTLAVLGCGSFLVLGSTTLLWFRRTGRIEAAGHAAGFGVILALAAIVAGSGGIRSAATPWYLLTPLMVTMVAGRRAGLRWAGVAIVTLTTTLAVDLAGLMPADAMPPWFAPIFMLLAPAGLVLAVVGIVWTYEVSRDAALQKVREASEAAEEAHREARRVLDNVDQGLVVVHADGTLGAARSTVLDAWFGAPAPGEKLWELIARHDQELAMWLEMGWVALDDDLMPPDVILAQLPKRLAVGERRYALAYRLLEDGASVMLVVSDHTEKLAARAAEAEQREKVQLFTRGLEHPDSILHFIEEARGLMAALRSGEGSQHERGRWLHTLKGNAGSFGLHRFANTVHGIENALQHRGPGLPTEQRERLEGAWQEVELMVEPLLRQRRREVVIELERYTSALDQLTRAGAPQPVLEDMRQWTWRSMQQGVESLAGHSRSLAQRIGKPEVVVAYEADQVAHPDEESWRGLWCSLVHVVRNALDHGIEAPNERKGLPKSGSGTLSIRAWADSHDWVIEVGDDGRGIDWQRVAAAAKKRGLAHATRRDLEAALFADGFTTREEVTCFSGRGVGMAAVQEAVNRLQGRIEIESDLGEGTTFRFRIPRVVEHTPRFTSRAC